MAKRALFAGVEPGKEVNPNAVEAMRDLGCDLTGHRPRHVSDFQILLIVLAILWWFVPKREAAKNR